MKIAENEAKKKQAIEIQQKQRITISFLSEKFIADHVSGLRTHTQADYKSRINRIVDKFGDMLVSDFTRQQAREWLKSLMPKKHPVTVNRTHAVLSKMLSFALSEGYIKYNPMAGVGKMGKEQSRRRYYSDSEIRAIWEYLETIPGTIGGLVKMMLLTAQRRGETSKMRWKDIDHKERLWIIPESDTKNKQLHSIPLTDMAYKLIESQKPVSGNYEYVFNSLRKPDAPLNSFSQIARDIQKATGINDFRFHDLRRTVATYMAKQHTLPDILKKILNHKQKTSDSVTLIYDRYDYMNEKRDALELWEKNLQSILTEGANFYTMTGTN